jgi:hypothetical protein
VVPLRLTVNFNEGWNAFHTADLIAGRPLYPDPAGVYINNYPPLSFHVVALASRALGDPLIAGRIVSLAAFMAWTTLLVALAVALGCTPLEGAFGAAIFAADMLLTADYYVGADDPQMLAQAIGAAGLLLAVHPARTRRMLAAAAVLLVAAVFTKQNVVAPIAAVAWLAVVDRPSAWRLVAYGVIATAAAVALFVVIDGRAVVTQPLLPRPFRFSKLAAMSVRWLPRWMLFVPGCVLLGTRARRDPGALFALVYAGAAAAAGLLLLGGEGVYWNALFEAQWALALSASVALSRLKRSTGSPPGLLTLSYAGALVVVLGLTVNIHWLSPRFWLDPRWHEAATASSEIEFLRRQSGAALCEDMTLCYFAGKAPEVDVFAVSQLLRRDPRRAAEVARRIDAQRYAVIVLRAETPGWTMGADVDRALAARYRVDHLSQWGGFLIPRSGG